jgi:hypothetical protein
VRQVATRTGNVTVLFIRRLVLQQLRQGQSSGLMHGGTDNGFDRFQIEPPLVAAFLKNNAQKTVYFANDLALDLIRRFFSCSDCSP